MGNEYHSAAGVSAQGHDRAFCGFVESSERLIHDKGIRAVIDRSGDSGTALHSAGKRGGLSIAIAGKTKRVQ
ncbi:hypothetical protein SDC9_212554 [bioreactor metagenome]|uniref:Uncharacterized protein n=1 Tax=bioreactor metagenome TaxID=1076179 RepID=A0A645JN64_9ZZZZ